MLTRDTLLREIAKHHGISISMAGRIYSHIVDMVKGSALEGHTQIPGLVTIRHKTQKARPARNFATGEPCMVKEKTVLKAKVINPDSWGV